MSLLDCLLSARGVQAPTPRRVLQMGKSKSKDEKEARLR
jgi:hypothetical protein